MIGQKEIKCIGGPKDGWHFMVGVDVKRIQLCYYQPIEGTFTTEPPGYQYNPIPIDAGAYIETAPGVFQFLARLP